MVWNTGRDECVTAVAKFGKARHPGIAERSVRESEIAVPSGEAGPSWSGASVSASTAEMADAKTGETWPDTIWVMGGTQISRQENVEVVSERVRSRGVSTRGVGLLQKSLSLFRDFVNGCSQCGRAPREGMCARGAQNLWILLAPCARSAKEALWWNSAKPLTVDGQ